MTPASTTPAIDFQRDVDAAIEQAKDAKRPVLIDFTAAPA